MFDLGFQELVVIFIVALLVFGPKKLPELAKTLGKGVRDLRQAMSGVKEQIDSEIHGVKDPISFKKEIYKDSHFLKEETKISQKGTEQNSDEQQKKEEAPRQNPEVQNQKRGEVNGR